MVSISHGGDNTEKLKEILEEARKRFTLFGFERTTMNDIATHVAMSKGSLYYYFPDKQSLFKAVIEKEQEEFFEEMRARLEILGTPEIMLRDFIHIRHEHFKKFINLNIFRFGDFQKIKPHIKETFTVFRVRETQIIEAILSKGINSRDFSCQDPLASAALCLDILQGLRMVVMQHRDYLELTDEDYLLIETKHQAFIETFIKSLKNNR
jgi:AcrR family transcriptional regulator